MPSSSSATSSAPTCTRTLAYVPPTGTSRFPMTGHMDFNIEGQQCLLSGNLCLVKFGDMISVEIKFYLFPLNR